MLPAHTDLAAALNHSDSDIREQAILDLQGFGHSALPFLISALSDPSEDVRWQSATVLRDLGPDAKAAVPALTYFVQERTGSEINAYVRGAVCDALGAIGPEAKAAVPALLESLSDESLVLEEERWLRLRAAEAVLRIVGPVDVAIDVVKAMAHDEEWWLRDHARKVVEKVGG